MWLSKQSSASSAVNCRCRSLRSADDPCRSSSSHASERRSRPPMATVISQSWSRRAVPSPVPRPTHRADRRGLSGQAGSNPDALRFTTRSHDSLRRVGRRGSIIDDTRTPKGAIRARSLIRSASPFPVFGSTQRGLSDRARSWIQTVPHGNPPHQLIRRPFTRITLDQGGERCWTSRSTTWLA